MTSADFLKIYHAKGQNLMWFLGAGASASSGIPTASDMTWDFKRTIFCAEQKLSIRQCQDISDPRVQNRIQSRIDQMGRFPAQNAETEYAELFLDAYPDEGDRRLYIDRMVSRASPSFGHVALAVLSALQKVRIVWTTNFDKNVEDAAARVFKTTAKLNVATLDTREVADNCLKEERWPLLVKLHGDFQSRRLKNTSEELRHQDQRLRATLVEASKKYGLVLVGYSGRDSSIMEALEHVINSGDGFPHGVYWICRPGSKPYERALSFLEKAKAMGISAHLVESESFDEFMGEVLLMEPSLPDELSALLDSISPRVTGASMPDTKGHWPVIRLNALHVYSFPTICRRLVCSIGGMKEVRQAVKESGENIIAVRRKAGVLAFGDDSAIRRTFDGRKITEWDLHSIEPERLGFDSMELSMVYDGLVRSLARERNLVPHFRQGLNLLAVDHKKLNSPYYAPLVEEQKVIAGKVPKIGIGWTEAILIRLEFRCNKLWLIFEPTIWVDSLPGRKVSDEVKDFHREKAAVRYNKKWNQLLEAWSGVITNRSKEATISAFGIGSGVDAVFSILGVNAFSRKAF